MDFSMGYQVFPQSSAACKYTLYNALLRFSLFYVQYLISSFILSFTVVCLVNVVAGEVFGIFILV